MDFLIEYTCQICGATKSWVYREEEGLIPEHFPGCPGGCQISHDLQVKEITEENHEERAQRILDAYPKIYE